ncbi:uncharacterized protein [Hyperolius riggenbachi]|uniref:uncharacterized protein isoform X3 n=1 Tax=Hyperolius riggenbachi TaxID=752182 RepID=UPI0035A2FD37
MAEEGEIIEFLTISMARITGTLLLSVYNYNLSRALVSRSALGILLIILALILAHTGIQKKFSQEPVVVTLCMTVSALWSNSGILQLLVDNEILSASLQFQEVLSPGLLAICCAFLIIGCVATLQNMGPLPLLSFALGLANIHVLALFHDQSLGSSGIACNFMIVAVISIYLVAVRFSNILKPTKTAFVAKPKRIVTSDASRNQLVVTGILANIVSSSVLCGKLMGTSSMLFSGQSLWLFTSAAYQIAVSVASFCARDILQATFFSLLVLLRFVEGYSLLYQSSMSDDPLIPPSFMFVFGVLYFALSCMMSLQNVCTGCYMLLFAVYCCTLTLPTGINHRAPQILNLVIFLASNIHMFLRLLLPKTHFKILENKGIVKIACSCLQYFKRRQKCDIQYTFSFRFNEGDVEVIGHAFNTLASFSLTVQTQATFMLVIAAGIMVHIAGLMCLFSEKAMESSAFIFYGILWVTWGFAKYIALYASVKPFYTAVGIICFIVLNAFVAICMTALNKAWFMNSLLLELLLICSLLETLNIVSRESVVAFSILFGIMSFYCFLTTLVNGTLGASYLPWGKPFIQNGLLLQQCCTLCPLSARKITSIRKIAGKCLDNLGLANSSSLLGSSKNIILYTSDYEVTTQIIDLVGPIAVRLLGMRTQGLMLSNLPKEVDGILIDDMQNNDYEFTIIDCMDVDRGKIEIIKEGAVSTSQVMDVLHAVNAREESSNIQNSIRL